MVQNALLAVAAGRAFGLSLEEAAAGLASAPLTKARLQIKEINGVQFLDDSYNANPDSMKAALQTLVELDSQVKSMATANPKPNLLPTFARLDELTRQLPPQTAPDLLHYLHKKSYEKARLFLQDRDAENQAGNCRHV